MKILSVILLSLFSLQLLAQQKARDMADARAKLQALTAMTQASQGKTAGKITYSVNGKTYTESNGISTVVINGKIGDIANAKHSVSIGDRTAHTFKVGQSYSCNVLMVLVDGVQYARRAKENTATITSYDGKTVKGKFSGTVYNEQTQKTLSVSGTFELNNVTTI